MTEHYNHSGNGSKRKCEAVSTDSCASKRARKDSKKSKSSRERDRILLENFVKYGILPPASSKPGAKALTTTVQPPISPIRKHKRLSEDQRVPEIDRTDKETYIGVGINTTMQFWRPWLESHHTKESKSIPKLPFMSGLSRTMPSAHNMKTNGHRQSFASKHSCENIEHKSQESRGFNTPSTTSIKSTSPTSTVTTWDTRSPEFLNSFKHPVRLMWPRSQAFNYKYKDAQQLLHNFPVQAVIDFYEDHDGPDDRIIQPHHRRLLASESQRCTPVLN